MSRKLNRSCADLSLYVGSVAKPWSASPDPGNTISRRSSPPGNGAPTTGTTGSRRCEYCERFFARYQCAMSTHLECDCPKCQGYCECSEL